MKIKNFLKITTDFIITILILFLVLLIKPLNQQLRTKLGKLLGYFMYFVSKKRRDITLDNLRKAFPDKNDEWVHNVCIRSYENLGIVFAEIFWLHYASKEQISKMVRFSSKSLIPDTIKRQRGLIVMSGHFGNWELMALSAGLYFESSFTIIVKPQSNKFLDRHINQIRTKYGNKVIDMYNSSFELIKLIKNKGNLALLADQSATSLKDIYVDFFGRKTLTFDAPAQLALRFQIPIILGFAIRQQDGSYFVELSELDYSDLTNTSEGIAELTQRYIKILEEMIRRYPDHWVWQHRRWKHTIN